MSNERKTILIKPEDFKIQSSSKTRKKRDPNDTPPPKLRVKSEKPKMNKTTKNQVLKYIRQQQEQKYKKLLDSQTHTNTTPAVGGTVSIPSATLVDDFNSDFKESLNFLNSISENVKVSPNLQSTLKYRSPVNMNIPPITQDYEMVNIEPPDVFSRPVSPTPQYGCLKGGSLPTYRIWKNKTQKQYVSPMPAPMFGSASAPMPASVPMPAPTSASIPASMPSSMPASMPASIPASMPSSIPASMPSSIPASIPASIPTQEIPTLEESKTQELLNKFKSPSFMKPKREIQSFAKKKEEMKAGKAKPKFKKMKQRKTMRRTYRLGKSKHYPRVSVLVSNRTLRKQISSRAQELKQVPIEEVKKTLIKKGFIKVGSIAPPDVLRKMYESVSLICGEIQNHNPDNLIYNYFNAEQ